MTTKLVLVLMTAALLFGCGTKKMDTPDSTVIEQEKEQILEPGVIGQCKCIVPGYKSTISIKNEGDSYTSSIDFEKENMESKSEVLIRVSCPSQVKMSVFS